jgi:hypothetical protein
MLEQCLETGDNRFVAKFHGSSFTAALLLILYAITYAMKRASLSYDANITLCSTLMIYEYEAEQNKTNTANYCHINAGRRVGEG